MEILLLWVVLSIVAGIVASAKGRSGFGYFILSILTTPLVGLLLAGLLPSLKQPPIPAEWVSQPAAPAPAAPPPMTITQAQSLRRSRNVLGVVCALLMIAGTVVTILEMEARQALNDPNYLLFALFAVPAFVLAIAADKNHRALKGVNALGRTTS